MSTNVLRVLTEEAPHHTTLPMPPYAFGLIALALFALMLAILWSFRNTAQKHVPPSESHGSHGEGHATDVTTHGHH